MEPSAHPAPRRSALSGPQRLLLAVSAAGAVLTLCWAALQVRAAREESRQAREALQAKPSPPPALPAPDLSARVADLESQLRSELAKREHESKESGDRIRELEKVVTFLRQENEASQKTIERLSGVERDAATVAQPVQTSNPGKSRDR